MAKKGGAQKIQDDITTDEELERFLDRSGLLDIYSEWCGPCLGMVGSLKKIKLESGGDNLSLAICKSDTIEAFKRFRRKSEPTWLFVVGGKAVNIMFGSDTPKLMNLILQELRDLDNKNRKLYDINEYQPEEEVRRRIKEDVIAEAQRKQYEAKENKRVEYLTQVTDVIMDNLSDIGVTVFGPQVNRDTFKKIMEPADALKIQYKDRKLVEVAKHQFETVHFQCPNPIDDDVLDQLDGKELLICFWKVPGEGKHIPKILNNFANELMKSHTYPPDEFNEEEIVVPPILMPLDVKVEVELQEGEVWIEEPDESDEILKSNEDPEELKRDIEAQKEDEAVEEDQGGDDEQPPVGQSPDTTGLDFDLGLDDDMEEIDEEEDVAVEAELTKRIRLKKVRIPPIWVPNNHRTHAALIYVFFRNQTTAFLPPDPIPEPPHVIMAFEAYKKRDLISHAERHRDDVPMYGFFTSDYPQEAEFIANSLTKYKVQTANDKIVLKVNKTTSHTMLSLVTYGPSYVSPNVTVGQEEAKMFFPESYKTVEQELAEETQDEGKKKEKSKKGTEDAVEVDSNELRSDLPPLKKEGEVIQSQNIVDGELTEGQPIEEIIIPEEGLPTPAAGETPTTFVTADLNAETAAVEATSPEPAPAG